VTATSDAKSIRASLAFSLLCYTLSARTGPGSHAEVVADLTENGAGEVYNTAGEGSMGSKR